MSQPTVLDKGGPGAGGYRVEPDAQGGGRSPDRPATAVSQVRTLPPLPVLAMGAVAVMLIAALAQLLLISPLTAARAQQVRYANFRTVLAQGTAPTGAVTSDGLGVVPGTPIAIIGIPRLDLSDQIVLQGTASGVLQAGPGHLRSSVLPGQSGVSLLYGKAWSYGAPFRGLDGMQVGDTITTTTGQGESTFRVTGVRQPGDVRPTRKAGLSYLTLVTATGNAYVPDGVVYVDATNEADPYPAGRTTAIDPTTEGLFAIDRGALAPALLWSQALLVVVCLVTWAYIRWGRAQAWVVGVPVVLSVLLALTGTLARLLPNVV